MQLIFGAGDFFAVPSTDYAGNGISNPTPIRLGVIQSMTLEVSGDMKELHGQYSFAVDSARGKGKVGGKVEFSQVSGRAINSIMFGQTETTGTLQAVYADTTGQVVPASPYQITVAPPGSGTFVEDLGVVDIDSVAYTRVGSTPAARQYSVNPSTGVYTFNSAQAAATVYISYRFSATALRARSLVVNNVAMGQAPTFKAIANVSYKGKSALVILPNVMSTKLALLGTKLDDYSQQSIEYSVFTNGLGTVFEVHVSE